MAPRKRRPSSAAIADAGAVSASAHVPPEIREYCRGRLVATHELSTGGQPGAAASSSHTSNKGAQPTLARSALAGLQSVLTTAFLPEGYPESVSGDYLGFQAWDTVQALSSYVRGMLTSQAILHGVGVGQQAATPLAAVFLFFLRDLAGMLGGILFAFFEGSSFDSCAKQWRLFADVTNDVGMTVELCAPLLPRSFFLPIACFGSVARALTGVAGGATRAALTQHFAQRGNAADVAAKEQTQETVTTMAGMVLGMLFTRATAGHAGAAWLVFSALTLLHVYANVRALRCLVLASLNQPRLDLLLRTSFGDSSSGSAAAGGGGVALTPLQVSLLEDLTPPPLQRLRDRIAGAAARGPRVQVHFGCRLAPLLRAPPLPLQRGAAGSAAARVAQQLHRRYMVLAAGAGAARGRHASSSAAVHVLLHRAASPLDLLHAYVHAACLAHVLRTGGLPCSSPASRVIGHAAGPRPATSATECPQLDLGALRCAAAERAAEAWMGGGAGATLVAGLAGAGWQLERVMLPRPAWTAEWQANDGDAAAAAGQLHVD